jgi:hypothetical protein
VQRVIYFSRHRRTGRYEQVARSWVSISLEGYGAGPAQDMDNPLGVGGIAMH